MYLRAGGSVARARADLSSRQRRATEVQLVHQALRRGLRYERLLTDMVLQLRHPERRGALPGHDELQLWREWRAIRDQVVRPILRVTPPRAARPRPPRLGSGIGQSGRLRQFRADEVILDDVETRAVLSFFWPERRQQLQDMTVTAADRAFAQALLVEAVDATLTMGVVEELYRRFFGRVPRSFQSIATSVLKVIRRALHSQWLRTRSVVDPSRIRIYENVRVTLARNFRSVLELRLQSGELVY